MSLTLALMFCERELPWLKLHLPVYVEAFREHPEDLFLNAYAASDETDGETARYLASLGFHVLTIPFHDDWSQFWNAFLDCLRPCGVTKVLRLDADELIFPRLVPVFDSLLDRASLINIKRYNFWYDRKQYNVNAFPDFQMRCYRLTEKIRYISQRHEGITGYVGETCWLEDGYIYHYGDIGQQNIRDRALRYINYDQVDKGLPLMDAIPADRQPGAATAPFEGEQPLDPDVVGLTAPFKE